MTKSRLLRSSRKLFFEMLVVFLGVLAAFWVEGYRESIDAQTRAERILAAFQFDMQSQINWYVPWFMEFETIRQAWATKRDRGEPVPPPYIPLTGAPGYPITTWDAALATDALRVIEPTLVRQIGNFYYESNGIGATWLRYIEHSQRFVLPILQADPAEFIDSASGRYSPNIQANILLLNEVWFESFDKFFAWPSWMIGEIQDYIHASNGTRPKSLFCAVYKDSDGGAFSMADGLQYGDMNRPIEWIVEIDLDDASSGKQDGICWTPDDSTRASCRLAAFYENLALMSDRLNYQYRTVESLHTQRDDAGCEPIFGQPMP